MAYKYKLPAEAKAKWIAALRDRKRKQVTGYLQTEDGQCCLGVACEVIGKGIGEDEDGYFFAKASLQPKTPKVEDFDDAVSAALFQYTDYAPISYFSSPITELMRLNDTKRATFDQIADWIDTNL